jgi:outer membrane protein OmpA-like peptidoglycan-associated protein
MNKLKNKIALLFLVALMASPVFSQTAKIVKADKNFKNFNYKNAIKYYLDLAEAGYKASDKGYVSARLGDSYRLINDPENAELWYRIAVEEPKCNAKTWYYFAQVLRSNRKYNEASGWMKKYLDSNPEDKAALKEWAEFKGYANIMADSVKISIKYMENINTKMADFSPAYYKDMVIFVSSRDTISARRSAWTDEPFYTLYESKIDSNYQLTSYKRLFGSVNTRLHEGPVAYDSINGILYFTRNNYLGKKGKSKDNTNYLKVYQATKEDGKWQNIKELPFNNDEYTCAHPALSPDGKKLYFISNMPGGYGGSDLYYVEKQDSGWSKPKNAGEPINTAGDELFPSYSFNGTLYFASNGHPGLGGLDIFYIEENEVKNIGYPINTSFDDFGITTINDEKGFFSSNRNGGYNNDDIYFFRINQPPVAKDDKLFIEIYNNDYNIDTLLVNVLRNDNDKNKDIDSSRLAILSQTSAGAFSKNDKSGNVFYKPAKGFKGVDTLQYVVYDQTNLSDTASLFVYVVGTNPPTAVTDRAMVEKNTVNNDIYVLENDFDEDEDLSNDSITIVEGTKHGKIEHTDNMVLYTPKKDYWGEDYFVYKNYDLAGHTDVDTAFIKVYTIFMGQIVTPDFELNLVINFRSGRWDITPKAAASLDSLVTALKDNPTFEIELGAHTDSRGSATFNQSLSQKRAESAVSYIIKKGIDKSRLTAKGYGESQPTNKCSDGVPCTKEEHARNRRVTIRLTKF